MHGDIRDYRQLWASLDSDSDERDQLGVLGLHHVGILTYKESLPHLPWEAQGEVVPFQCYCYLWRRQEFVVPYGGPLLHALTLSGTRLHHLAYSVRNLEATSLLLRTMGFRFIDPMHTVGIGGMLVNFLMPEARGLLIELVELPKYAARMEAAKAEARSEFEELLAIVEYGKSQTCGQMEAATGKDCPLRTPEN